jgi:hypothetical protein
MTALELDFADLAPIEVPVKVNGVPKYVLVEASGAAAVAYRNMVSKAAKMVDGKVTGLDGIADAEPLLVSLCLSPVDDAAYKRDGVVRATRANNNDLVTLHVSRVKAWPYRFQRALFDKVMEISPDLREKDTPESVRKRIAELQAKLAELEAADPPAERAEDVEGKSAAGTGGGSASPTGSENTCTTSSGGPDR